MRGGIGTEQIVPCGIALGAGIPRTPTVVNRVRNLERRVRPFQRGSGQCDFILAQRRTVRAFLALLVRRSETDRGPAADQGRLSCFGLRGTDGLVDFDRIVTIDVADDLPAVGFETGGGIIGEPTIGVAVNRDAVVVPEADQLAHAPGAGQRSGFVRHAFHQTAVPEEHPGGVVDDVESRAVETLRQHFLGQGETDGIGQSLPQRAGGGFHAGRFGSFRMAGGTRMQLAEALQLVNRQIVSGQVQQRVMQHRAVAVGQYEAVAVGPLRIHRIMPVVAVPEHLGDIGHAHRHARMPGLGRFHGVDGEKTDGIGQFGTGCAHGATRVRGCAILPESRFIRSVQREMAACAAISEVLRWRRINSDVAPASGCAGSRK